MLNVLTIDVEDYFQVSAFEGCVSRDCWDNYQLRVEVNTVRILDLLDEFAVRASFFVLGWVAERKPSLVKEIAARGHEVASHGYGHRRVSTQTRQEFRDDIRRSKMILEDLTATEVSGYRAPSYSVSKNTLWAFDELLDAGYSYDSSVFPIRHDLYGIPDWPRFHFTVERVADSLWEPASSERGKNSSWCGKGGVSLDQIHSQLASETRSLVEVPITTLKIAGRSIPISGGGYFRFFPYAVTKWGLNRINRFEGRPFVFYIHPWEIDRDQPRMAGASLKARFRHYLNLARTEERFRSLLADFMFIPMKNFVEAQTQ